MIDTDLLRRLECAFVLAYGAVTPDTIARALTDVRHLCDRMAFSHGLLDQSARQHYLADSAGAWTAEEILRNEG